MRRAALAMQPQYPALLLPHDENLVHPKRMPVLAYPRPNPFRLGVVAHGLPPLLFSRLLHRHNNAQSGAAVAPGDESRLTEVAALIAGLEAEGRPLRKYLCLSSNYGVAASAAHDGAGIRRFRQRSRRLATQGFKIRFRYIELLGAMSVLLNDHPMHDGPGGAIPAYRPPKIQRRTF